MLKSNKGITMTSLVIYIIVLMIVIALMSTFSGYFYGNVKEITIMENSDESYTKIMSYLTKDLNSNKICFITSGISNGNNYLIIKLKGNTGAQSEHQYIHYDKTLYFLDDNKKINLSNNVTACSFDYNNDSVEINMTINNKQYTKIFYTNS